MNFQDDFWKRKIEKSIDHIQVPESIFTFAKELSFQVEKQHKKRELKNLLVAATMFSVLGIGILLSPTSQAVFNGLFEVTKFEKSANKEEISFGYVLEGLGEYGREEYGSLEEIENTYNIHVPFPEQLLTEEENAETTEYSVGVDKEGNFRSYHYILQTKERNYDVFATNAKEVKPKFLAETKGGTAINKKFSINGSSAKLLGANEMDGYYIYIEKGNWKVIISCFSRAGNKEGVFDVTEEEIIKIAESIKW
jgi:hypothetical protein